MNSKGVAVCSFDLEVDYSLPMAELLRKGMYDYDNESIVPEHYQVENLPMKKVVSVTIFGYDRNIYAREILPDMNEEGFRPGNAIEVLNLGIRNGELQRKFPITALAAIANHNGIPRAICLYGTEVSRCIAVYLYEYLWLKSMCFMGVKIEKP